MNTNNKILLVVNPIAGDNNKEIIINELNNLAVTKEFELHIFTTTGDRDKDEIKKVIDEIKPARLLVAGGDGSIKLMAEILRDYDLPLGILPSGSANGLAKNLELPETLEEQIEIGLGDQIVEIDILELNDNICIHIADLGLNAELIHNYEDSNIRGKLGYLLQSIPTLIQSKYPFNFDICIDNEIINREGILLAFANANKYGTGANINPTGKINDGKFEVLIFKNFDIIEILKTLRNEVAPDPEFVEVYCVNKVTIKTKIPVSFQIDGEYIGETTHVEAKMISQKLKIAVPSTFKI